MGRDVTSMSYLMIRCSGSWGACLFQPSACPSRSTKSAPGCEPSAQAGSNAFRSMSRDRPRRSSCRRPSTRKFGASASDGAGGGGDLRG